MPIPLLTFLIPALGSLTSLASQLLDKDKGGETIAHYGNLLFGLLGQGLQAGIDIDAELKVLMLEMQTLVAEGRAATNDEMRASNQRLKASVAAALAHDVSTHPSIDPDKPIFGGAN